LTIQKSGQIAGGFLAVSLLVAAVPPAFGNAEPPIAMQRVEDAPLKVFEAFLDRLMVAESGGRRDAKNPRSTALGPFQFIKSTFLEVARRHFVDEIAGLTEAQILALRTDPNFARRSAAAYCRQTASQLKAEGLLPTFAHLRLAYLLGPADAVRVLQSNAETPISKLLSSAVVTANPFMRDMDAGDLIRKSERDLATDRASMVATPAASRTSAPSTAKTAASVSWPGRPVAQCNARLASCRQFLALVAARAKRGASVATAKHSK
jgi:hypothetical protein